jgi:3-phosphoshikimate 1-carboxyvinyltransferase
LNEKPYIEMTLKYLHEQSINFEYTPDFSYFKIFGGGSYKPVSAAVPGDFSSAAFPALAAVVSGGTVELSGLDPDDTQGDKAFFTMLSAMGADVAWKKTGEGWVVSVSRGGGLAGGVFDLNATPDLLPAACVLAAYARGESAFINTGSARIKETDRIAAMAEELAKAGIKSRELPDGIVVQGGRFSAAVFDGRCDHRIVMALSCAALGADAPSEIIGAEAAAVTYPGFLDLIKGGETL